MDNKSDNEAKLTKCLIVPRTVKLRNCRLRVVVVSDTHYKHASIFKKKIPDGDVLLHCGDFSKRMSPEKVEKDCKDLNDFFKLQTHRYKFLIAGNHEMGAFKKMSKAEIQALVPDVTYLSDDLVDIEGVKLFGHYWGSKTPWAALPDGIDILATHMPPFNILDLAWENNDRSDQSACPVCGEVHPGFSHWGDADLLEQIVRLSSPTLVFSFGE
jgi:hypothetical protein